MYSWFWMSPSDKNSTGERPTLCPVRVRPLLDTLPIAAGSSSCHAGASWFLTDTDEQYGKLKTKSVSDLSKVLLSIIFTHIFAINTFTRADTCCSHISNSTTFLSYCLQLCEFTYALYVTHGANSSHRWKEGRTCELSKWELINNRSMLKLSPAGSSQMPHRNLQCNVIFDHGC